MNSHIVRAAHITLAAQSCDLIGLVAADLDEVVRICTEELASHGRRDPQDVNTHPLVRLMANRLYELAFPSARIGESQLAHANAVYWCRQLITSYQADSAQAAPRGTKAAS